jgi:Na+/melibiose symporter-like transporter
VPIGIAVGAAAAHLLPPRTTAHRGRLDLAGALTLVAGLGTFVYAVAGTAAHGWGSARTLGLLAVAAAALAAFAAIERRAAAAILPPRTWRRPAVTASAAVMLGATGVLVGAFFLNSLYLQEVLGDSPLEAGLAFLPLVVAIGLAAHAAPHLLSHAGSRLVAAAGLMIVTGGALALAFAPDRAAYLGDVLPGLLAVGFGVGLTFPAASVTAMDGVGHADAGLVSGVMSTAHELGAAIGTAVLAAVAAGGATPADGYGTAFLVAAGAAAALAVAALATVPAVRPSGTMRAAMH